MEEIIEKQPLDHSIEEAIEGTIEEDKDIIFEEVEDETSIEDI